MYNTTIYFCICIVFRALKITNKYLNLNILLTGVDILSCKETEMDALLKHVLSGLLENGVQEGDIAILVGKKKELNHVQVTLSTLHPNAPGISRQQSGQIVNSR